MIKRTKIQMLNDYCEGLNSMRDAASQMVACHRLDPKWMGIRDMLNILSDGAKDLVKKSGGNI